MGEQPGRFEKLVGLKHGPTSGGPDSQGNVYFSLCRPVLIIISREDLGCSWSDALGTTF